MPTMRWGKCLPTKIDAFGVGSGGHYGECGLTNKTSSRLKRVFDSMKCECWCHEPITIEEKP